MIDYLYSYAKITLSSTKQMINFSFFIFHIALFNPYSGIAFLVGLVSEVFLFFLSGDSLFHVCQVHLILNPLLGQILDLSFFVFVDLVKDVFFLLLWLHSFDCCGEFDQFGCFLIWSSWEGVASIFDVLLVVLVSERLVFYVLEIKRLFIILDVLGFVNLFLLEEVLFKSKSVLVILLFQVFADLVESLVHFISFDGLVHGRHLLLLVAKSNEVSSDILVFLIGWEAWRQVGAFCEAFCLDKLLVTLNADAWVI